MSSILSLWRSRRKLSALALAIVTSSPCVFCQLQSNSASPYQPTRWGTEQGLSSGPVQAIAQTPNGYLWIGTSSGLFRFDGFRFVPILTEQQQQPLRQILALTVDHQGNLWVRTADTRIRLIQGERISAPITLEQRALGSVSMATGQTAGIYTTDIHKSVIHLDAEHIDPLPIHSKSLLISVAEASDRRVWIGTDRGLISWMPGERAAEPIADYNQKTNCLLPGRDGTVWIGTDDGLIVWDGHKLTSVVFSSASMQHLQILTLMEDSAHNLWLGTSRGLVRYTSSSAEWIAIDSNASDSAVTALMQDREGDIWLASGGALERLKRAPITPVKVDTNASDDEFGPIYVDPSGRIWFAKRGGGLFYLQKGITHAVPAGDLSQDVVYSLDGSGNDIWVGRRSGGLTRLRVHGNTIAATTWTTANGLAQNSVYVVRVASDGTVWAGTLTAGLIRFRDGKYTSFTEQDGLPSNAVSAIEIGSQNEVWIGTPGGICMMEDNRCSISSAIQSAPKRDVLSLSNDPSNGLWVGTSKGLFLLTEQGMRAVPIAPGSQPMILGLGLDRTGWLWIATDQAVMSTPANRLLSPNNVSIRSYGKEDGLQSTQSLRRSRSVVADPSGRVWIATVHELAMTASATESLPAVISHVEQVSADGALIDMAKLQVPAGAKRLSFAFTGIDLYAPSRVRFRYRLDNFDKSWSDIGSERQATYTNLAPGKYTFRLIASNESNLWNSAETTLSITVEPLLWQRWSVRVLLLAAFIVLTIAFYRARTRILLAQANALAEERLRERTRIAREVHDTLLQGFISSLMHLHVAEKQLAESSPLKNRFVFILEGMERVIEEARLAVVGLRTPDSGHECLESSLREFFQEISDLGSAKLTLHSTGKPRRLKPVAFENISAIAREAVLNSVRHASASSVQITIVWGWRQMRLEVRDDGCGMEPSTLENGRPQHWGLASMRERAPQIKAKLDIKSQKRLGTQVMLNVPGRSAYW